VPVQIGIAPATVGENSLSVQLPNTDPQIVERVQLNLTFLDADLGSQPVVLDPAPDKPGTWQTSTPFLSQPGQWQADLLVRRTGQDDLRGSLRFAVSGVGGGAPPPTGTATAGYPLLTSPITTVAY